MSSGQTHIPQQVPAPADKVLASLCPSWSARLTSTALSPNEPSGWAEIRHPFHPHRGQRFAVLKARCVAGVDTLILRDAERGSFAVAREWRVLVFDQAAMHTRRSGRCKRP